MLKTQSSTLNNTKTKIKMVLTQYLMKLFSFLLTGGDLKSICTTMIMVNNQGSTFSDQDQENTPLMSIVDMITDKRLAT